MGALIFFLFGLFVVFATIGFIMKKTKPYAFAFRGLIITAAIGFVALIIIYGILFIPSLTAH